MGDGAYLFDPQGDLRAGMQYPCRTLCPNPAHGAVVLRARATGRESVMLRNVGGAPVDLEPYRLESWPYAYAFRSGTVLAPGSALRIRVGGRRRADTPTVRHWGKRRRILNDGG